MTKRFLVAFSFPADKRTFVAHVARLLANRFGADRILFDEFHQAEFARPDLGPYLSRLYNEDVELLVAVVGADYDKKRWIGLEWNAIYERVRSDSRDTVLLGRFDRVDGAGLYGIDGFIDLDGRSAEETADLVQQRLSVDWGALPDQQERRPTTLDEWPEVAPGTSWFLANQLEARDAFTTFVTRESAVRLLMLRGPAETGKTMLTREFLANALKIPRLTSAALDFKGAAASAEELRRFAGQLQIAVPGESVSQARDLARLFLQLKGAASPTLLIFDTFERAGEGATWVEDELFHELEDAPWLRVVVAGQRLPRFGDGSAIASIARTIEVRAPTVEDWQQYADRYRPGVSPEAVRTAYDFAGGRATLMAQLFGPV